MNELTKEQEIAIRLLATQEDVIWANEDQRANAIANAIDTARMFLDISEDGDTNYSIEEVTK